MPNREKLLYMVCHYRTKCAAKSANSSARLVEIAQFALRRVGNGSGGGGKPLMALLKKYVERTRTWRLFPWAAAGDVPAGTFFKERGGE